MWLPLKPKLFCGVASLDKKAAGPFTRACAGALDHFQPIATHAIYATIIVKRLRPTASRATPPHRQNQPDVALCTSDRESETGNYKGQGLYCQGPGPLEGEQLARHLLVETLEESLQQIPDSHANSSQYKQDQ